ALWVRGNNTVTISNLTLQSTGGTWANEAQLGNPTGVLVSNAQCIIGSGMTFVQPLGACMVATNLATLWLNNGFTVNGSSSVQGQYVINCEDVAVVNFDVAAHNITITGTVKVGQGFVKCDDCAVIQFLNAPWTFTGYANVQGPHYGVFDYAIIETAGGGATYFPGTLAGVGDGTYI